MLDTVGKKKPNQITFQTEALHVSFTRASNSINYSILGLCAFQWFVKPYAESSAASSTEHLLLSRNSQLKVFTKTTHATISVGLAYMALP